MNRLVPWGTALALPLALVVVLNKQFGGSCRINVQ